MAALVRLEDSLASMLAKTSDAGIEDIRWMVLSFGVQQ